MSGPNKGHVLAISKISLLLDAWCGSNFHWWVRHAKMDTLELCGDILQPGGQLETPGLVDVDFNYFWPNWGLDVGKTKI